MTQQNQFWQRADKGVVIDKIRNTITIESFSAPCGDFNGNSVRLIGDGTNQGYIAHNISNNNDPTDAVTVEGWFKLKRWPASGTYAGLFQRSILGFIIQIEVRINSSGHIEFLLLKNSATVKLTSASKVSINDWVFISASWDGVTMRIFQNGEEDANTQALALPIDECNIGPVNDIGYGGSSFQQYFNGWVSEVRIWNAGRTRQDILNTMYGPRNYNDGSGIDDDLIYYYKCNEGTGSIVIEWVNSENAALVYGTNASFETDDAPPLKYGASFVIANFDITLAHKCSLIYPVEAPEDVNMALVVRWEDDEGLIQRRFLWTVDGVEIAPNPAPYRGERLPLEFSLEVWNIDGEATIDLVEDLILETSIRTLPITSIDTVQPSLADITCNIALASIFPFSFPVLFNTAPTFILPSSAAPSPPTNIGSTLGESGSVLGEGSTGLN